MTSVQSIITVAKITKPYTLAVNVYFHICYFKVSYSKEISQIQKYGHSLLASWFQGNACGGAATQVMGVSWVYCWYFLALFLSLLPLSFSCNSWELLVKMHMHLYCNWMVRSQKMVTSDFSMLYLLIFCVTTIWC